MPESIQPDNFNNSSKNQYEEWCYTHYGKDSFWSLNKEGVRKIGFDAMGLLSDLLSKKKYFENRGQLDKEGYFYNTEENREEDTGLSPYRQQKIIDLLQQIGILYPVARKGLPAKQKFKFNYETLWVFLHQSLSSKVSLQLVLKKFNDNNKNKKNDNKEESIRIDSINDSKESSLENPLNKFQRLSPIISLPKILPKKKAHRDFVKPGTGEMSVLLAWNKLPSPASTHAANTKTAKTISEYLSQMRSGVFGRSSRRSWDGKFLDKHKIGQKEFEEKTWSFLQIRKVVEGPLADMYKEGYWPESKKYLPRDLPSALYNPRNQNSFFMIAAYDPPGKLKSWLEEDPCPLFTEELIKTKVIQRDVPASDRKRFFEGVRGIKEFLGKIDWENRGAREMFGKTKEKTPYLLLAEYLKWLRGKNADLLSLSKIPDQIHLGMFRPEFWMWRKFMEAVNRYWGSVFKSIEMEGD